MRSAQRSSWPGSRLGEFAAFPAVGKPGAELTLTARAPVDAGEGLVVYAWLDIDVILRALGVNDEPKGLVEVDEFPAHALRFTLALTSRCSGPEALYP